jgi:lipopolysaccharide/colanic/teichoic acid biosynthesis glycosyltransferase
MSIVQRFERLSALESPPAAICLPRRYLILKRAFDFAVALVGLVASSPLWALIALAIWLEDGRPVFFRQERVGLHGRRFRVWKFRTMRQPRGRQHEAVDLEDDYRVTKVGRLLRATAMDDLPALLNILVGDMSFVGPRTLLPFYKGQPIEQIPGFAVRSLVRPGLTGVAQVYASKDIPYRQKFSYDTLYIRRMSLWLDLKLFLLSFWVTFRGAWERRGRKI